MFWVDLCSGIVVIHRLKSSSQTSTQCCDIQNVSVQMLQEIFSSSMHAFISCYISTTSHCKYKQMLPGYGISFLLILVYVFLVCPDSCLTLWPKAAKRGTVFLSSCSTCAGEGFFNVFFEKQVRKAVISSSLSFCFEVETIGK